MSKPRLIMSFQTDMVHPIGIQHLSQSQVWVRGGTQEIKRFDLDGENYETFTTETGLGRPSGLIVLKDESVLYTDLYNKIIYKMNQSKGEIFVETEWHPMGMVLSRRGDFLVCMAKLHRNIGEPVSPNDEGKISRYSVSGKKLQEIYKNNKENLFIRPICMCENINQDICVSDAFKHEVIVIDSGGNFKFSYNGNFGPTTFRQFSPTELDTDSMGNIFVCDFVHCLIHMINIDGTKTRYFLSLFDGIESPRALTIDSGDKIWMADESSGKVKVYINHEKPYGP